jgi:hypothetical protein
MGQNKKYKCPLCGSLLTEAKFYEIVGVWEAKAKAEKAIKEELATVKRQRQEIIAQLKADKKRFEREKKLAIKDGIEKGKQKEKSRADRLSKLVKKQSEDLQRATQKIKDLEKHLKDGTTPQTAGHDFEKELVKQLQQAFPSDKIEHTGKGGDIFHRVISKSKEIGSILYECKKTAKYNPDYIHQTKKAIAQRNASYGILVTFVSKKGAQGFFVDNDVIVVHPFGTVHIAQVLRNFLVERHLLKLNQKEFEARSQNLMDFIKSDDFKNSVENTIYRTQELAKMLIQEFKDHKKIWEKRIIHYNGIHSNTSKLQMVTKNIVNGQPIDKNLIKTKIKQLPAPEL